ncbi:DUF4442 domain-containing protein [Flavobacteriaceae bacterium LMO-SS05]
MKLSPSKLNMFLLYKLPAAYFSGVRTSHLDSEKCSTTVKFRWINQNPFKSMYWAVQGMAAELATGAMLMSKIKEHERSISMLLAQSNGMFIKRVTGRVIFTCYDSGLVDEAIDNAIKTGEGKSIVMTAIGINEEGIEVSKFNFEWTIKVRS